MFCEAKLITPIMAADRSTLSCRAIVFLFVLIAIPTLAGSATLEDSAKELADKIAASLSTQQDVSYEIRNLSSLTVEEVARIEQTLKAGLQSRGLRTPENGDPAIRIQITLSGNLKSLLWTAEIKHGDSSQVILLGVPSSARSQAGSAAMPILLRTEKFWEGSERILDAEQIYGAGGKTWLVLLLRDGLSIQGVPGSAPSKVEIQSGQSANRDPRGTMSFEWETVSVVLPPRICTVALETRTLVDCQATESGATVTLREGNEYTMVNLDCPGAAPSLLETGLGDYTQPDSLRVYGGYLGKVAASNALDFPGPILAFHPAMLNKSRAIVRNLKTGNYEAYHLLISCAQ